MSLIKKLLPLLGLLILAALFFTSLVLGGDGDKAPAPESVAPMGTLRSDSLTALEEAFGLAVPHGGSRGIGSVEDAALGSLNARLLTWQAESGLTTQAVRPAEAAQLLRREGLVLDNSTLWSLDDITLLIAAGDDGACAYYQDDEAAYSLFLAGTDTQGLLEALSTYARFPE